MHRLQLLFALSSVTERRNFSFLFFFSSPVFLQVLGLARRHPIVPGAVKAARIASNNTTALAIYNSTIDRNKFDALALKPCLRVQRCTGARKVTNLGAVLSARRRPPRYKNESQTCALCTTKSHLFHGSIGRRIPEIVRYRKR